jgi:hypothetical protein
MATVAGNHDQDQITNYEHTTMGWSLRSYPFLLTNYIFR